MRQRCMAPRASPAEAGLIGARFGAQSQSRNGQAPLVRFRSLQRSLAVPRCPGEPSPERSRFSVLPASVHLALASLMRFFASGMPLLLTGPVRFGIGKSIVFARMPTDHVVNQGIRRQVRVIRPALPLGVLSARRSGLAAQHLTAWSIKAGQATVFWPCPTTLMGFWRSFAVLFQPASLRTIIRFNPRAVIRCGSPGCYSPGDWPANSKRYGSANQSRQETRLLGLLAGQPYRTRRSAPGLYCPGLWSSSRFSEVRCQPSRLAGPCRSGFWVGPSRPPVLGRWPWRAASVAIRS